VFSSLFVIGSIGGKVMAKKPKNEELKREKALSTKAPANNNTTEAIREKEELFRNVYNTAPLAFVVWDLDTLITDWNEKAHKVFGWSKKEVLGRSFFDFLIPEMERPHVEHIVNSLVQGKLPSHSINDNLTKDGRIITCEWNNSTLHDRWGNVIGAISLALDITDRNLAEKALRDREATLKSIFRAAPTGIGLVKNRVLKRVNDRICQMTGYSRRELLGQSSRILYPSDKDFNYVGSEKYAQISKYGTGTVETKWRRKDGKIIDVLLSSTPLQPSDLGAGVTFTALDITDRKKAENSLKKALYDLEILNLELERKVEERTEELMAKNKQLARAEKLAALGQMANRVAHELRNPLMAVGGFARRISEKMSDEDQNKKYLQMIVEHVMIMENKVAEIINSPG
jgi:PAS domain S-box-containing protein